MKNKRSKPEKPKFHGAKIPTRWWEGTYTPFGGAGKRRDDWISQLVRNWYAVTGKPVPEMGTPEFATFVGGTVGMLLNTIGYDRDLLAKGQVYFADTITAEAHMDGVYDRPSSVRELVILSWTIKIPLWTMDADFYRERFPEADDRQISEMAVATIDGLIIHEGLHLIHTKGTKTAVIRASGWTVNHFLTVYGRAGMVVIDAVEDHYIESTASYYGKEFLLAAAEVVVPEALILEEARKFEAKPTLLGAIKLIASLRRPSTDAEAMAALAHVPGLVEIVRSIPRTYNITDRVKTATEILKLFPVEQREEVEAMALASPTSSDMWSETPDPHGAPEGNDLARMMEALNAIKGQAGDKEGIGDMLSIANKSAQEEIQERISGWLNGVWRVGSGEDMSKVPPVDLLEVQDLRVVKTPMKEWMTSYYDHAWVRRIKALRTVNHVPGPPMDHGNHIQATRLARIASDGKIFNLKYQHDTQNRVEVVILMDISGSTAYSYGSRYPLWAHELSAGYHMFMQLRSAGVPVAAYAHSARKISDKPTIVHLTSYDMPGKIADPQSAFERTAGLFLQNNYDGFVIEKLAKVAFTGRKARRVLIVLSDGIPHGHSYSSGAVEHTQAMVKWVRKLGIEVFSLSLLKSVVYANNGIYGEEYNLDASGNLDDQMKTLIEKLV